MRKKYLSALLFGALLFASAGTFTSCKDYDDDINGLRTEITDLKSAVEELQQKIGDGKFVTNVAANGQGLTISWNDGSSTTIENVINEATGETGEGSVVTFDEATGEILINGEGTGYYASKSEIGEYKAPYVNEDGALVLINEEGEEVVTDILTAPVTAVENADGSVTLTIRANGTTQTVLVPSAASSITGISLLDAQGNTITNINDLGDLEVSYWTVPNGANWKGPRGNIPAKSVVYSSKAGNIYFNLDPAGVDATEMSFNLINSHDEVAPLKLVTPEGDEKLMSRASTYQNGLYITGVSERSEIFTYTNDVTDFTGEFKDGGNTVLFALTPQAEGVNVRSPYYVGVAASPESADLTNVIITGTNDDAGNTSYSAPIQGRGTATIRVGRPAEVTVVEEYKLYDLYMEVTEAAKDKFGLVIDNEARTIEATKSPDDLTDASFDLVVYAMNNAGKSYKATTFTVTVNRSMAESAYEKQTKALTKLDDTFAVSATPLFNGLGDQLNDWKESVDLAQTKFELLEMDENSDLVTATEGYSSFKGYDPNNTVQWVATKLAPANGYVAFLASNNKITNSAASLANIQFNLNIPQSGSPIKIDKDYYVRLTFYSNEGVVLNTAVVPFVLTKPELSTILVKESGVFRDGDNLAYAYMYWGDAYMNADKADGLVEANSDGSAASIYYIDRAFTDLYKNLDAAGMFNHYSFALDASTNISGSEKSSAFATSEYIKTETSGRPRAAIKLNERDNDRNGVIDGYKKDLIVNFNGYYLDVQDDSYKYTDTYKFRVMSPILEGEAIAANNLVQINATGRTKLYKEDIWAKTYNNDEVYNIFAKGGTNAAPEWYRADIENVTFDTANKNVFEVTVATPTVPVKDGSGKVTEDSYIEVEGVSANTSKLNIAVEDIWGYTLQDQVDIQTTVNLGE